PLWRQPHGGYRTPGRGAVLSATAGQEGGSELELELELDSLGERQVARPVDGVGLAAHVGPPGIGARLAAAAGILLPAEGATDLGARGADVDVGDAAVAAGAGEEELGVLQAVGEEGRAQAVGRRILLGDGLFDRLDRNDVENGAEGLGLHDGPVVAGADECRLDEVTGARKGPAAMQ